MLPTVAVPPLLLSSKQATASGSCPPAYNSSFPPLRAAGLLGPLLVMLREHGQIWDLLDRLEAQVSDHDDPAAMHQTYGLLESILGEHNAKEEVIVYPAGDERLTGDVVASIRTALTTGEPPPGWTCEMAGRG